MITTYWEEQKMHNEIHSFHEQLIKEFGVKKWIEKCPFCQEELPLRSIRQLSIKLNSRNIGDLAVEFCCAKCNKMDTIYFRKAIKSLNDASPFMNGTQIPIQDPILEENMYKMGYNNLVEEMMSRKKE